ncbi:MAG: HD domain-containing phosphohydrolase [Chloroflexota bacterium]
MFEEYGSILLVGNDTLVKGRVYQKLTGESYLCHEAATATEALGQLENNKIDLVLLDTDMADIPVVELLPKIRTGYPETAIITATEVGGTNLGIECVKLGAYEYITKPLILDEVFRVVTSALRQRRLELLNREYRQELEHRIEEQAGKIRASSLSAITALAFALEAKDKYTAGHSRRVARISIAIADEMGLSRQLTGKIRAAALVHDVGKIGIKESILNKATPLSDEEVREVRKHPELGEYILTPAVDDKDILGVVKHHHERYDGTGYPDQLENDGIPLGAQILALADAYEAMTSLRPYRRAISSGAAFTEIIRAKGTQFDPEVVEAFVRIYSEDSL